jgi:hypothetical protein
MNTHIGRWIVGGILGAAALTLVATGPAFAVPAPTTATFVRDTPVYSSPSLASEAFADFSTGDEVQATCFINADYVNGTDVWLRLAIESGGGWISRSSVEVSPLAPC